MEIEPHHTEIDRSGLSEKQKLAMMECVLAWAHFESQLRALLTAMEGRPLDDGAKDYSRLSPDNAWKKIIRQLQTIGASSDVIEAARQNRKLSKQYYENRKTIVHAGCVGTWKANPSYVVFSAFENYGPGELALIWMPIDEIEASGHFARGAGKMCVNLLKLLGH